MRILVESLKRLFQQNKITIEKLRQMQIDGKISEEEYNYIIGK